MFTCDKCHLPQPQYSNPHRIVVDREEVSYPFRRQANREVRRPSGLYERPDDHGGQGWQIVREEDLCDNCFNSQWDPPEAS